MSSSALYEQSSVRQEYCLRIYPFCLYVLRPQQQSFSVSFAIVAKRPDFGNDHRR